MGSSTLASLIAHELSVMYYTIFSWRKNPYTRSGTTSFTYHTNSNWLITVLILSKLLIIEGAVAHILLMQWSHIAAWVLTISNLYVILLLTADCRATRLNPILVSGQEIRIQYGLQLLAYIDIHNIESLSVVTEAKLTKDQYKTSFTPLSVEPNVHIKLKDSIQVIRMFGSRQHITDVYLFLDDPRKFQTECLAITG